MVSVRKRQKAAACEFETKADEHGPIANGGRLTDRMD